jgi:hypothetical protein
MPSLAQFLRRISYVSAAFLAAGILISCATKNAKPGSHTPAAGPAVKKPKTSPASSPAPTPTPAPTPQAHYTASVKVEGEEVTQNQVLTPDGQSSPSPTPSPTPAASPSPTPKPKAASKNFVAGLWQKVFPPKPTPAPTPGETGGVTIRVSSAEGGESEQVVRKGTEAAPNAIPAPTPIQIKTRPSEGFLMRMWHKIFPKKQEPPAASTPQWIGTIKLINERENYALIDSASAMQIPVGETLNSVGETSESGALRVTADRTSPFFIADIVSGKPRAGDRVYSPKP